MSDWQRGTTTPPHPHPVGIPDLFELSSDPAPHRTTCGVTPGASCVTPDGADWLASACTLPASVHALWLHRPGSPSVLPCGTAFDVVSAAPLTGRLILERLWSSGPGSGPVAVHRGRLLLFAARGTAQRLPALLSWGEWKTQGTLGTQGPQGVQGAQGTQRRSAGAAAAETFPSLLCLGTGDSVTIPALHCENRPEPRRGHPSLAAQAREPRPSRWLVAPDVRHPWLPGPEVLLRACVRPRHDSRDRRSPHLQRTVRAGRGPVTAEQSISGTADRDARVYDVTRRR